MDAILAPSLLSADLAMAGNVCKKLEESGISWLHLDIMDGHFVPNITFGPCLVESLRKICKLFFDVHLMIEKPELYIDKFINAGADLLVVHLESTLHPQLVLEKIRERGVLAGIAINPGTDFRQLRWLLPYLDMILVMGVNPGFSGQRFIPETLSRLSSLRMFLEETNFHNMPVEMDGGACPANVAALVGAGADILVSGSAFFSERDFKKSLSNFEQPLENILSGRDAESFAIAKSWKSRILFEKT